MNNKNQSRDITTRQKYFDYCEEMDGKETAKRYKKYDVAVCILSNLSISQKAKDNFQDYFDHLIAIQDYAHFDGLVTGTFELMRPWILDQNRQLTCQLMEQQSENNAIAQFFDIIQISRYWPHRSRTSICEYFCNKQPDDIEKVLRILNLR